MTVAYIITLRVSIYSFPAEKLRNNYGFFSLFFGYKQT